MNQLEDFILPSKNLLDQMPGLFTVTDLNSQFIFGNRTALELTGFKTLSAMENRSYTNMPCKASENCEIFVEQDKTTIIRDKYTRFLGYYCCAKNEWKLLLGEKYPLKNNRKQVIGSAGYFIEVTHYSLLDFAKLFLSQNREKNQMVFSLEETYPNISLTKWQTECMFYLLRGKTAKEIGKILKLSPRTVEAFTDQIKDKLGCRTKYELIEKSILKGFLNMVPNSLLENK